MQILCEEKKTNLKNCHIFNPFFALKKCFESNNSNNNLAAINMF